MDEKASRRRRAPRKPAAASPSAPAASPSAPASAPAAPLAPVVFVHPDLGIGGAERLVVDAALALQQRGHAVRVFTSHHDPAHCFEETRDGTLAVEVRGDWLPRHLAGRLHVVCAIARALWTALRVWLEGAAAGPRAVLVVDQLSAGVPLLRLTGARVLFYCHFPDLLLASHATPLQRAYRAPVDAVEELTTGMADRVLVNSRFTAGVYRQTFPRLAARLPPAVLYPSINLAKYDRPGEAEAERAALPREVREAAPRVALLSINRFERKKNIALAVRAFVKLRGLVPAELYARAQLVLAGGYDPRVAENVEYHEELRAVALEAGLTVADYPDLTAQVVFLRSFTEAQRSLLLDWCAGVVYTPANEHFGIVPVEAMYASRPVIAVNNGGPLESVRDGETGFLCPDTPDAFADAMRRVVTDPEGARRMGVAGRQHVIDRFSLRAFGEQLQGEVQALAADKASARSRTSPAWLLVVLALLLWAARALLL